MWQQFLELWTRWRPIFDCALETINPRILEEDSLNQSFLLDFASQVKSAYLAFAPSPVRLISVNNDAPNNWLIMQFGITHARKLDEIGIRWSGDEVTVDFLPGGSTTCNVCFKDNYGLRWVMLDCSRSSLHFTKQEKADIERIITNVYAIAQHYKNELQFIIGHSAEVRTKERKF